MEIELRALDLGEVLDRTIQIYRSNFLIFVGIASLAAGIDFLWRLFQIVALRILPASHVSALILGVVFVAGSVFAVLLFYVVFAVVMAAITHAVTAIYLGKTPGVAQAFGQAWQHWFRYTRLNLAIAFLSVAPILVPLGIFVAIMAVPGMHGSGGRQLAFVGVVGFAVTLLLVTLPLMAWLVLRYMLANPACVFEDIGVGKALKRGTFLSQGQKLRILILLFFAVVAQGAVSGVLMAPAIPFLFFSHGHPSIGTLIYITAAGFVGNLLVMPIIGIGLTVCYFDSRIRKEGFDVEWMLDRSKGVNFQTPVLPGIPGPESRGLDAV